MNKVLVLLLYSVAGLAQTKHEWHINVSVDVFAKEPLQSRITSYCTRELRSIKGVDVVPKSAEHLDYSFEIVAISSGPWAIMSTVLTSPLKSLAGQLVKELGKPDFGSIFSYTLIHLQGASDPVRHLLRTDSNDKLDEMCKELIADIDGSDFETNRKLFTLPAH